MRTHQALLAAAGAVALLILILLGAGLLATGGIESIGLSAMGTSFALGVTLSLKVKDTEQIREKLASTEGPVLLPALLLAGAHLAAPRVVGEWWMLALATAARIAATAADTEAASESSTSSAPSASRTSRATASSVCGARSSRLARSTRTTS